MIIVSHFEADELGGKDTLLALHVDHYRGRFQYVQQLNREESPHRNQLLVMHAAQLCEMSRDLTYKLNRVSVELVQQIVSVFQESVDLLQSFAISDEETSRLVNAYVAHIVKRIDLLKHEIATAQPLLLNRLAPV